METLAELFRRLHLVATHDLREPIAAALDTLRNALWTSPVPRVLTHPAWDVLRQEISAALLSGSILLHRRRIRTDTLRLLRVPERRAEEIASTLGNDRWLQHVDRETARIVRATQRGYGRLLSWGRDLEAGLPGSPARWAGLDAHRVGGLARAAGPAPQARALDRLRELALRRRATLIAEHESVMATHVSIYDAVSSGEGELDVEVAGLYTSLRGEQAAYPGIHPRCRCAEDLVLVDGVWRMRWMTARDTKVCPRCRAFDGAIRTQ